MSRVARPFAQRHRQHYLSGLRFSGWLLLFGVIVLGCTVGPTLLLWWNSAVPAAIGTAIFAVLLFSVVVMLPLEFVAAVHPYFDRRLGDLPFPGFRFGLRLYRDSGRLDALAREAGLPPLSEFEAPDDLDSGQPPPWHAPEAALPTVEHLLARVESPGALHRDLAHLQAALRSARDKSARFCLVVKTWSGVTNAEREARRCGSYT